MVLSSRQSEKERLLVSIIVPMYNAERNLKECLDSIIHQDYENLEIILVDDGSNDSTLAICSQYSEKDPRFLIIRSGNEGVSNARNLGIEKASGEYVVFIDADDWIEHDYISRMVGGIAQNDADIFIVSYYEEFKGKSKPLSFFRDEYIDNEINRRQLLSTCLTNSPLGNTKALFFVGVPWGKIYKRAFLNKCEIRFPYGIVRMQDSIFNLYAFKNARKIVHANWPLYHYRRDGGSVTHRYDPEFEKTSYAILDEVKKFYSQTSYEAWEETYYSKAFMNYLECIRTQYLSSDRQIKTVSIVKHMKRIAKQEPYVHIPQYVSLRLWGMSKRIALLLYDLNLYYLLLSALRIMRYLRRRDMF